MHKKIIEKALGNLDADRATYFGGIVTKLEEDKRIEDTANVVYTVLKDVMADLPTYLEQKALINLLLDFTNRHFHRLKKVLYDPDFVRDPSILREVTGEFVHQVVKLSLEMHDSGEIQESKRSVHKLTWPYRDTDVFDPEEDEDEYAEALARSQKWLAENGGVDRRGSGTARIDDMATEIANEIDEQDKPHAPKKAKDLKITDL